MAAGMGGVTISGVITKKIPRLVSSVNIKIMSVIVLDPRFPGMVPVEAVPLVGNDVCYTEEVPVRIRWVIADLGGHVVEDTATLITTDPYNDVVRERLHDGDRLLVAPSLSCQRRETRALPVGESDSGRDRVSESSASPAEYDFALKDIPQLTAGDGAGDGAATVMPGGDQPVDDPLSAGTVVEDEVATSAGLSSDDGGDSGVPAAVVDEIEEAIVVMSRALRQGEWEQSQSHESLLAYMHEEVGEFADSVTAWQPGDVAAEKRLCDELSDILLQVLFHAEIANRRGAFDIGHVAASFVHKMRSRAPYLFEDVERLVSQDEQNRLWEEGKRREQSYTKTSESSDDDDNEEQSKGSLCSGS